MIFNNSDELFLFLRNYYRKNGGKVDMSTFGMYLGITVEKDWSSKYKMAARDFINEIKKEDLRLVVGLPYYQECKPDCKDCMEKYNDAIKRHKATIDTLKLNARFHPSLHLKMCKIGNLYVTGGINLGPSKMIDTAFVLSDSKQKANLDKIFKTAWDGANNDPYHFLKVVEEINSSQPSSQKNTTEIRSLYLDDIRNPRNKDLHVVRNFNDCIYVLSNNSVDFLSLDHDLGGELTGYHVAKFLVYKNMKINHINIHSANPVGRDNIAQLIKRYFPTTNVTFDTTI